MTAAALRWISHRGEAAEAAENSLEAFTLAARRGADIIEFDLHQTRDKELVVHHDLTLARTTTGRGPICWEDAADLKALRLRGPDGKPTEARLPFLADVLGLFPGGPEVMVELKQGPFGPYRGLVARVVAALREHGALDRTWLASSSTRYLRDARALAPGLRIEAPGREGVARLRGPLSDRNVRGYAFMLHKAEASGLKNAASAEFRGLLRFAILPNRLRTEEAKKLVSDCVRYGVDGIVTDSLRWRDFLPSQPTDEPVLSPSTRA